MLLLLALGLSPMAAAETPPARPNVDTLLSRTPEAKQRREVIQQLSDAGDLFKSGDPEGAEKVIAGVLELYSRQRNTAGAAEVCGLVAGMYRSLKSPAKSLEYCRHSVARWHRAGEPGKEAAVLEYMATIHLDVKELRDAQARLSEAVLRWRESGEFALEATALARLAALYEQEGRKDKAAIEHTREGKAWNRAAEVAHLAGALPIAEQLFLKSLEVWRAQDHHWMQAYVIDKLGLVYSSTGQFPKALRAFDDALSLLPGKRYPEFRASVLFNTGRVYYLTGDVAKGLRYFNLALGILDPRRFKASRADVLNGIGMFYMDQRNFVQAEAFFRQALPLADRAARGQLLLNLGGVASESGFRVAAMGFFEQARSLAKERSDFALEGAVLNAMAMTAFFLGPNPNTSRWLGEARSLAHKAGDLQGEAAALENLGTVEDIKGRLPEALAAYEENLKVQEAVLGRAGFADLKSGLADQAANVFERAIGLALRLGRKEQAFELTERARARTFVDQIGNAPIRLLQRLDPSTARKEYDARLALASAESALRKAQAGAQETEGLVIARDRRLAAYRSVLQQARQKNRSYDEMVGINPPRLSEIQRRLDRETVLVSYHVEAARTIAFLVTRESLEVVVLKPGASELRDAIAEFREAGGQGDRYPKSLERLSQWLVAPLKVPLGARFLGVIPHGVLHYVPFAALKDGAEYLANDGRAIFMLPSAGFLVTLASRSRETDTSILTMAPGRIGGVPFLPLSAPTAGEVAQLYGSKGISRVDGEATETLFKSEAGRHGVVFVAAHGEIDPQDPLRSRIVLGNDAENDGSLQIEEVLLLSLARTDLLVLGACKTELAPVSRGEEMACFGRAFLQAGCTTVVGTLWSVREEPTALLMKRFFTHLAAGKGKALALQQAQADTRPLFPHPRDWAGFILTGEPRGTAPAPAM
jgi:CHAT domain-containing protein/Tfp pilus assembly protein PilF